MSVEEKLREWYNHHLITENDWIAIAEYEKVSHPFEFSCEHCDCKEQDKCCTTSASNTCSCFLGMNDCNC